MEFFPGLMVPVDAERWVDRMLAGLEVFESTFGVSLAQAHSGTKSHATTKPVSDRRKFFAQRLKTKSRGFSLFTGRGFERTPDGLRNVDYFMYAGRRYAHDGLFSLILMAPAFSNETAETLLVAIGDAAGVVSAQYSPEAVARRLRLAHWCIKVGDHAHRHPLQDRTPAESCLPVLRESTYDGLTPRLPHHFGWLNYWSQEVCETVGFPERAKGCAWLEHCRATPRGAWLIKLGAHAPPPGDDAFAETLRDAYDRFPSVGYRLGM